MTFGWLTDEQFDAIELEEDTQRKDLTAYERSKNRVQEAAETAQTLRERALAFICPTCGDRFDAAVWHCPECGHHWGPAWGQCEHCLWERPAGDLLPYRVAETRREGRPDKADSEHDVAEALRVNRETIRRAEAHVRAVETHGLPPTLPQSVAAIETARTLGALPEPDQDGRADRP